MPAGTSASLCWILLSVCLLFASTDGKIIKAEPGQNISLPCRTPNISVPIRAVEWFRLDLQEGHVLMYRGQQFISMNQLPSFVNRVDLQDRQMKDGDVSLILKDVMSDDTGTFQCYVVQRGTNGRRSIVDHISTVYLRVVPPGEFVGRGNRFCFHFHLSPTYHAYFSQAGQPGRHSRYRWNEDRSVGLDLFLTVCFMLVTVALAFFMTFTIPKTLINLRGLNR
ncbi:unnamed protein product [Oreochromis niloticus]|nr:unnamed protein product [Mustela putorius furo]